MTPANSRPLLEAFKELKGYGEDVARSDSQVFLNALQRFVWRLEQEPIKALLQKLLPTVDFPAFLDRSRKSTSQHVGSGSFSWPPAPPERVALQFEYLRSLSTAEIEWRSFFLFFHWGDNYDDYIRSFVKGLFLPFHRDLVALCKPALEAEEVESTPEASSVPSPVPPPFIHPDRITSLKQLPPGRFDLARLVLLCEEIDKCYRAECWLAVAALTRALLDHVPPLFGMTSFTQVANNYAGAKSFRDQMRFLDDSARKVGDDHLHTQIRAKEELPTPSQVNFGPALDVLLGEIIRITK
jgi:hypothetical protein